MKSPSAPMMKYLASGRTGISHDRRESEDNALELYDAAFVMFHRMLLAGNIPDAMWDAPEPDDEIAITTDEEVPTTEEDRYFA